MTTRREYDLLSRLRGVEPLSTAANTPATGLRRLRHKASSPTQPRCQSGFPAGSKRKLEFEYDWQGRRIKKVSHSAWNGSSYATVATTKFIYDGWNLLAELDSSNNVVRSYVWGTDLSGTMQGAGGVGGLLFVKESDSTPHFAAYDGNGNVAGLVKGTDGTRTATYEYDPFGQPLRATGPMALANPMRFSTKFTDNETGLLYYGYRYYSPSLGGWLKRDPIGELGGLNEYGFVASSPLNWVDLLGLKYQPKLISGNAYRDGEAIRRLPYKLNYSFSASPTDSSLNVKASVYGARWIGLWILQGDAKVDATISIICLDDGKITYSATGRSLDKDGIAQAAVAFNPIPLDGYTLSIHAAASGAVSAEGGPEIDLGDAFSISWPSPGLERTVQLGGFVWRCVCGK